MHPFAMQPTYLDASVSASVYLRLLVANEKTFLQTKNLFLKGVAVRSVPVYFVARVLGKWRATSAHRTRAAFDTYIHTYLARPLGF